MVSPMKKPRSEPIEMVIPKSDEISLTSRDETKVSRSRVEPEDGRTEERTKSLFEPNELKKLSVTINTSIKTVNTRSDTLIRYITDPDLIKPVRRIDEGKRPIFDRPEILNPTNSRPKTLEKTSEDRLKELRRKIFSSVDSLEENEVEERFDKRRKVRSISRSPSATSSRISRKELSEDSTSQYKKDNSKSTEKSGISMRKSERNGTSKSREDRYRSRSHRRNHRSYSPREMSRRLKLRRREDRRRRSRSGSDRSHSRDRSSGEYTMRGRSNDSRKRVNNTEPHMKRVEVTLETSSPETTDDDQLESQFLNVLKNVKRLARERKKKEDRKYFLKQVKKEQRSDKEKIHKVPKEGALSGPEDTVSTMVIASTSQSVELVRRAPEGPCLPHLSYYPHPPFRPHPHPPFRPHPHPPPGYINHRHPPPHPPPYSPPTTNSVYPPPGFYPH